VAPEELDVALDELENRLERLRALYEQYFLGIEKIEPTVQRKDVDRRIWLMRREQIRNTARRFKLQTLVQRYNTFQQYWARVCRDIENGTYARHLIRAEKVLGDLTPLTIAARKRQGMFRRGAEKRADRERTRGEQASEPPPPAATEPPPESAASAFAHAIIPVGEARPGAGRPAAAERENALGPRPAPPPPNATALAAPMTGAAGQGPAQARAVPTRTEPLAQLDLDMEFLGGPKAAGRASGEPKASPPQARAARSPQPPPEPKAPPGHAARPPPLPPRTKPAAPAAAAAPPATPSDAVSEQRIKEIHGRLVDAKRKCNEPPEVNVEVLGRSLRAVATRLRERHGDRSVDFDVVIKDGKAVIKPILR